MPVEPSRADLDDGGMPVEPGDIAVAESGAGAAQVGEEDRLVAQHQAVGGVVCGRDDGQRGARMVGQGGRQFGLAAVVGAEEEDGVCLLYTSPSPRDGLLSRMPSSA